MIDIFIHFHECESCGNVWGHGSDQAGNVDSHLCSRCGDLQWEKMCDEHDMPILAPAA